MAVVVIILTVVVALGVIAWFVANGRHPETAASHVRSQDQAGERHGAAAFFGDSNDRPAGPGAEDDGVAGRGRPAPGPSAEASDDPPQV